MYFQITFIKLRIIKSKISENLSQTDFIKNFKMFSELYQSISIPV